MSRSGILCPCLIFYRDILAIRAAHPELKSGLTEAVDLGSPALASWRCTGDNG